MRIHSKLFISAFLLLSFSELFAQNSSGQLFGINHPFSENQKKQFIELGNDLSFGSNGVDNIFANKMVFGGHIKSSRIADNYDRLPSMGRTNFNSQFFLRYWDQDTPKIWGKYNVFAEISTRYYGQTKFGNDQFGLVFRGNAPYAGSTIDGKDLAIRASRHTNYTFGLHRTKVSEVSITRYGLGLSYVQLLDYTDFEIESGSFYTEEFGQYLEMDLKYEMYRTERPVDAFKIRGHGASITAFYQKTIDSKKYFKVSIHDIGFTATNGINHYVKDTTNARYDGYQIISGSSTNGIIGNVLDTLLNTTEADPTSEKKSILLPGIIRFSYGMHLNNDFIGELFVHHILFPDNIPEANLRISTKFKDKYLFGISIGYGGFDRQMKIGFQGATWLKDAIYIQYDVSGLDGFVIPELTQGFRFNLGLGLAVR